MRYVKGDITETDCQFIFHGCNTLGVFGAGVALAIAKKWPEVKDVYMKMHSLGVLRLGGAFYARTKDGKVVVNLLTQDSIGRDGGKHASYLAVIEAYHDAIRIVNSIEKMEIFHDPHPIAMPKIGCTLGGLDWNVLRPFIEELEERHNREFIIYEV